ncbi:MAG: Maf family protein [Candidatus Acidiferrum sp.]
MGNAKEIPQIILASASPRRSELLRNAGIVFAVHRAHLQEEMLPGEAPMDHAKRLARDKARSVFQQRPKEFILGADTIVVAAKQVLGKPRDAADAARMLRLLSGCSHQVITAVCLIGTETRNSKREAVFEDIRAETTEVFMHRLTDEEIAAYIATGESMDKAGAYAIQGYASRWIPKIVGCYFNVVGLPVSLVCRMLREHGIAPPRQAGA